MVKHLGETTSLPSTGPWRETSASTGKISTQICVRHIPRTNSPDKNWRRRHENDWKSKMGTNPFPGIQTFRSFDGFWCKLPENIAADRLMVGRPLFPFWGPGCQSPPEIFTFLVIYIYISQISIITSWFKRKQSLTSIYLLTPTTTNNIYDNGKISMNEDASPKAKGELSNLPSYTP